MASRVYAGFSTAQTTPLPFASFTSGKELLVAHQPFFVAKPHFNHFLQQRAMPERRGARVDEEKEQIVRARTRAKRVQAYSSAP